MRGDREGGDPIARIAAQGGQVAAPVDTPAAHGMEPAGEGRHRYERETFVAEVARDGSVRFRDRANLQVDGLSGRFDLTDWAMRVAGDDPYRYEKARFLEETFELRAEMAENDRRERLRETVMELPRQLARLWASDRFDVGEKRRLLFELWDACAEEGDEHLLAAARHARIHVIAFIRARLPRGSAAGFGDDELAALNQRRTSVARFEPYANSE